MLERLIAASLRFRMAVIAATLVLIGAGAWGLANIRLDAFPDLTPNQVQVITVEVDVEEAEKLALASTQGRLRLALRNPLNAERVLTKGANVGSLLSSYRPKPAPKPAQDGDGSIRVEIIKGDVRKELKF